MPSTAIRQAAIVLFRKLFNLMHGNEKEFLIKRTSVVFFEVSLLKN